MFLLKNKNRAIIFEYSNFCNVKSSEKSFVGLDIYDKTDRARASRLPSHFRADFSPSFPPAAPTGLRSVAQIESSVVIIPVGCPSPSEIAMDQTFV